MAERRAYEVLRRRARGGLFQRVESAIMPGWPDLIVIKSGCTSYVEAKQLVYRARDGVWYLPRSKLKPAQRPTWTRIQAQGGLVYLLLRTKVGTGQLTCTDLIDSILAGITAKELDRNELEPEATLSGNPTYLQSEIAPWPTS